tara:strand:- start:242 stop:601 length:360 start_codon:yes stop_codon:yes gene_type:complete
MNDKESIKFTKEFTQKYNKDNPYYKDENEFVTRLTDEEKGINDKRIRDMENPGKKHNEDIVMDDMERITPRTQPTQEEIIEYNRKENQKKEQENTTVLVEKSFLKKLKDFEYWKEWKNQ